MVLITDISALLPSDDIQEMGKVRDIVKGLKNLFVELIYGVIVISTMIVVLDKLSFSQAQWVFSDDLVAFEIRELTCFLVSLAESLSLEHTCQCFTIPVTLVDDGVVFSNKSCYYHWVMNTRKVPVLSVASLGRIFCWCLFVVP